MRFLMENSYFTVGNVLLFRTVAVAMGSDPALFWVNIYLYNYESKYITNLIRTNKLSSKVGRFTVHFDLLTTLVP